MKQLLPVLMLALCSACGFQPVYAPSSQNFTDGGLINIAAIDGRDGYMLRRALQQELAAGVPGLTEYVTLTIDLQSNLSRLALRPDGAASRSSVSARGRYLIEGENTRMTGQIEVETGFLVPDSPYGDIAAQTSASDRAMRVLAKQIADDIRLKFAKI